MRKLFLIVLCLISIVISTQIDISGNSLSSFTHNFIPSNFSPKDLKPSDIPSNNFTNGFMIRKRKETYKNYW